MATRSAPERAEAAPVVPERSEAVPQPPSPAPRARGKEARPLKRLKRLIRYGLLRLLFWLVGRLPLEVAKRLGAALGSLAFAVAGGERRKALEGLAIAFPEKSEAEREAIARASFREMGRNGAEICALPRIDPRIEEYVELSAATREVLDAALADGRGIVFATAHVGNFELMARRAGLAGYPLSTIARESSDPRTTRFIERLRASGKVGCVWRGKESTRPEMLRIVGSNQMLGLLIDQDTRGPHVFVDFFGVKACTPRGAADLALQTGAAVLAAFVFRRPDGGHRIQVKRLPLPETSDREAACLELTQAMTREIEDAVRRAPEGWVWIHRRWKTRPPQ